MHHILIYMYALIMAWPAHLWGVARRANITAVHVIVIRNSILLLHTVRAQYYY